MDAAEKVPHFCVCAFAALIATHLAIAFVPFFMYSIYKKRNNYASD